MKSYKYQKIIDTMLDYLKDYDEARQSIDYIAFGVHKYFPDYPEPEYDYYFVIELKDGSYIDTLQDSNIDEYKDVENIRKEISKFFKVECREFADKKK